MTPLSGQPKVFLSYASQDKHVAENILDALERVKIPCWIAPRDVITGRPYAESIMQAIQHSCLMLLVFTSHANESPHVLREAERFVSFKRPILCVRIENVLPSGSMEYLISATHWADAVGLDRDGYCRLAVQQVTSLLNKASGESNTSGLRLGGATSTFAPSALPTAAGAVPVLMVLPFEDRTINTGHQYLCDGIGEDVIMRLVETPQIKVVSTHAVALLKKQGLAPGEIAARVNAGWILEGSLQGDGQHFRLNIRLVESASQAIHWAHAFAFEATGLFQTQQRLAGEISQGLGIRLTATTTRPEAAGQTQNSEALDRYFRARYQTSRRDRESLERAIALYEEAIVLDPGFVRAWARLSEVFTLCANYGYTVHTSPGTKAWELAERAVQLDESVPEAQVAMGLSLRTSHFSQSADRFRIALSLFPSNVEAHHYLAHVLVTMGEYASAEAEDLKALAIDPLYVMARAHLVRILVFAGRREEAMQHLAILEQDNVSPALVHGTRGWLHWCDHDWGAAATELSGTMSGHGSSVFDADICADALRRLGQCERAERIIQDAMSAEGRSHLLVARLARVYADTARRDEADRLTAEALQHLDSLASGWLEPKSAVYFYNRAWIYAVVGETNAAIEPLLQALANGYRHFAEIKLRPDWEDVSAREAVIHAMTDATAHDVISGNLT